MPIHEVNIKREISALIIVSSPFMTPLKQWSPFQFPILLSFLIILSPLYLFISCAFGCILLGEDGEAFQNPFYQSVLHILILDLSKYNFLLKVSDSHSPHSMLDECNFSLSEVNG